MKRYICTASMILAIVMIMAVPVSAAGDDTQRASNFFAASSTYLWRTSSTTFEVWFDIDALGVMDELGAKEIKVQKSSDGVNWTTMVTYTDELYPHLIAQNTGTHCGYVTYTGTPGYYYRARVTYYAEKGSGSGEVTEYTSSMIL